MHVAYFVNLLIERGDLDHAEHWLREFKPVDRSQGLVLLELRARSLKARNRDADLLASLESYAKDHADHIARSLPSSSGTDSSRKRRKLSGPRWPRTPSGRRGFCH